MIPSPKTASLVKAPPENRLRYEMTPAVAGGGLQRLHGVEVDAGGDDVVAQTIDGDDEQGEEDLVAKVRDRERGPRGSAGWWVLAWRRP